LFSTITIIRRPVLTFLFGEGRNVVAHILISGRHSYFGHPVPEAPEVEGKIEN